MKYIVENGQVFKVSEPFKIYIGTTEVGDGEYIDKPVLHAIEIKPTIFDIQSAILKKMNEINQLADTQLQQGFDSNALGEEHHYYNHDKFPQWYRDKATAQQTASRSDTVPWLTLKDGVSEMKDHTAEQFDQVFADLIAFEQPIEYKRLSLLEQAKGCETKEQLENIQW